jgi:hypothetical protein
MRAIMLAVLSTAACHDHLDLGSKPQLIGKLANLDLGMSEVEMRSRVPELDDSVDETTTIEYSANFDKRHLENLVVRVAQPVDDLFAAWGPGAPGSFGSEPARIYSDAAHGIRYTVLLDSNAPTGNSFTVVASAMRPLAAIFDDGPDVKAFGIDVLGGTLDQTKDSLTKQGVATQVWSIDPSLAKYMHSDRIESANHSSTEYGEWSLQVGADQDSHVVDRLEIDFHDDERDDAEQVLLALFTRKWGTPTRDGSTLNYPTKDYAISVELVGSEAELSIKTPKSRE